MQPFFPPLTAFIPFTYKSLLQRLRLSPLLSFDSCACDLKALVLSPVVLWYTISYCKRHAYSIIGYYAQFMFPRPENPDIYSLKGAEMDECAPEDIPGLGNAIDGQPTLTSEVKRDFFALIQKCQFRFHRWRNMWQRRELRVRRKSLTDSVDEPAQFVGTDHMDTTTGSARAGIPPSGDERSIRSVQKIPSQSSSEPLFIFMLYSPIKCASS